MTDAKRKGKTQKIFTKMFYDCVECPEYRINIRGSKESQVRCPYCRITGNGIEPVGIPTSCLLPDCEYNTGRGQS